jgi:hypothetical protein
VRFSTGNVPYGCHTVTNPECSKLSSRTVSRVWARMLPLITFRSKGGGTRGRGRGGREGPLLYFVTLCERGQEA